MYILNKYDKTSIILCKVKSPALLLAKIIAANMYHRGENRCRLFQTNWKQLSSVQFIPVQLGLYIRGISMEVMYMIQ